MSETASMIQQEISQKMHGIPPLSKSAQQLMQLMGTPNHEIAQVVHIVQCDAALTARVLTVVNSAAFGLAEPITSVARSISYLGDKAVLGIALDFCAGSLYQKPLEGYEAERGVLWDHNLRTAIAAKEIARFARSPLCPDLAFTAGILHDVGKSILSEFLTGTSSQFIAGIDEGTFHDYIAAEETQLGTNHSLIGAQMAKAWGMPEPLTDVIRYHHQPGNAPAAIRGLVYAVHLGDITAMASGAEPESDMLRYHLEADYHAYIEIPSGAMPAIMLNVADEFDKTKALIFGGREHA